ncbi:single-stranded DNA-binding protein [uncultured Oscillibacter sp.]|uniref:single-stranded DNA-binding protein n=1 Tax=uncultured Oscillibacter sp. TaxID=876091 RepID=UPI0025EBE85E|nr:single-stranded DNA-binding protein [uncultured Oscillibacter sp.]
MELTRNEVELCGTVAAPPVFSHENHGVRFYRVPLAVARLSGQTDTLPLLVRAPLPPEAQPGARVRALGQLRSYNNRTGPGSRLVLTVHVSSLDLWDGEAVNRVLLRGTLCKLPTLRRTPLGRSICDVMLAVGRRYGRADYLPLIVWGQLAQEVSLKAVGDTLGVEGRFQSRVYTKVIDGTAQQKTAYEVSTMHLLDDPLPE